MGKGKRSKIRLFQWNCRSIATNEAYLVQFLASNNCDVLILQSLNVKRDKLPRLPNFYHPPIFEIGNNLNEKVYTAIYIQERLEFTPTSLPVLKTISDIHSCAVTVKFSTSFMLNVLSVYLPKGPNDQNTEWLRTFQDQQSGKWIIGGDFNAHAPFWEEGCTSVTSNRLVENIVDSSFCLLNDGRITRIPDVSKHRATAIDISLLSPELVPSCSWATYDDTLGSDHLPILITFSHENIQDENSIECEQEKIPKYDYKRADWDKFQRIIACRDFERTNNNDVNILFSEFKAAVLSAADLSIPKQNNKRSNKRSGNIWWTKLCDEAVNHKKEKFKAYAKNKSDSNHTEMKKANSASNKIIDDTKKCYWSSFCTKEVSDYKDLKKVWKKMKDMKNGVNLSTCPIKDEKSDKFLSNTEKAETFAELFAKNSRSEGISPYCRSHREKECSNPIYTDPNPQNDIWFNSPITLEELKTAVASLSNKKCSVGSDAVSNEMLKHLPENGVLFLHEIFQKCWNNGTMPHLWKNSIVIPVLKSGKSQYDKHNYRPISLTSHTCKLMEKIVLNRLLHYCEKNKVIPINQAGFRKGRSTMEHLVKLSTQIKRQFARRKSVLATFFDVRKAYDQVWHKRLLYKLKSVGLSGNMYNYIKSFLNDRTIEARVGTSYSAPRNMEMGIPQGSVIAPILFNILIQDLPKALSTNVVLAQYADDICIWMNVTLKRSTPQRAKNYVQRLYQADLNSLGNYMLENGLSLSTEKTHMMLFNSGSNSKDLPTFRLYGDVIKYMESVKFLGVFFTTKLTWNVHIVHILTKARKSLNFLKIISRLPWGMDTPTLIHLSIALVRSRLSYAQEVFFSAPKNLLKKIQSLDCKAIKLALGVPSHASNQNTYKEAGIVPLDEFRELAAAKFVLRHTSQTESFIKNEIELRSDLDFPKRANSISSQKTIATYTSHIFKESRINPREVAQRPTLAPIPTWEMLKASFDIGYTDLKKNDNINILTSNVRIHIYNNYQSHLQIFTDGSVLENKNVGAAFVIPALKVEKSFFLGNLLSIFTAELVAVLKALDYVVNLPVNVYRVVIFIDSKSVLSALKSFSMDTRPDMIIEICHLIHCLRVQGTDVSCCWVPSHCGLYGNESADKAARRGANNAETSIPVKICTSVKEFYSSLTSAVWARLHKDAFILPPKRTAFPVDIVRQKLSNSSIFYSRLITSIVFRLRLNALRTKYCKSIRCICGKELTLNHIMYNCKKLHQYLPKSFTDSNYCEDTFEEMMSNHFLLFDIAESLVHSPIYPFL